LNAKWTANSLQDRPGRYEENGAGFLSVRLVPLVGSRFGTSLCTVEAGTAHGSGKVRISPGTDRDGTCAHLKPSRREQTRPWFGSRVRTVAVGHPGCCASMANEIHANLPTTTTNCPSGHSGVAAFGGCGVRLLPCMHCVASFGASGTGQPPEYYTSRVGHCTLKDEQRR
jgi:hypothetical protein